MLSIVYGADILTSGYKLVQVLCDASQVIEGVYGADIELHEDRELFTLLKELLNQDWMADIKLVERDENEGGADLLARHSFSPMASFLIEGGRCSATAGWLHVCSLILCLFFPSLL